MKSGSFIIRMESRLRGKGAHGVNRFGWVYLVDWTGRGDEFAFDDGEVSEVKWVSYSEMEKFRMEYAKEPLKKDDFTFAAVDNWLKMRGLVGDKKPDLPNYAFIDGQNLIYNTAHKMDDPWRIDLERFRIYLRDKYKVSKALDKQEIKNKIELKWEIKNTGSP